MSSSLAARVPARWSGGLRLAIIISILFSGIPLTPASALYAQPSLATFVGPLQPTAQTFLGPLPPPTPPKPCA